MKKLIFLITIILIQQSYGMGWFYMQEIEYEIYYKPFKKRELLSLVELASNVVKKNFQTDHCRDLASKAPLILSFSSIDKFSDVRKAFFDRLSILFGSCSPKINLKYFSKELMLSIINDDMYRENFQSQVYIKDTIRAILEDHPKTFENQSSAEDQKSRVDTLN